MATTTEEAATEDLKPSQWLRMMGAVRPMATGHEQVLVVGKWHMGVYPIQWTFNMRTKEERWHVFGVPLARPLTHHEAAVIVSALRAELEPSTPSP